MITVSIDCAYTASTGGSSPNEFVYYLHFKTELDLAEADALLRQPGVERDCTLLVTERGQTEPQSGRGQVTDVTSEGKVLRVVLNVPTAG